MALNNIYTGRIQGAAVVIGNTNVLTSNTAPTDLGSYVYTTTIPSLQVSGYPPGTTLTQSQNSSSAILNLPTGSTVIFAELTWVVVYESSVGPVTFVTPNGTFSVSGTTSQTAGSNTWRAADVTNLVASAGAGTYIVGNIRGNLAAAPSEGGVSWHLIVIYQNSSLPTRYINMNAGILNYPPTTYNFNNIQTPTSGSFNVYYFAAAIHGQYSDLTKVQVGPIGGPYSLIGNTSNPWNGLSPYNRQVSFFPSNICVADPQSPNVGLLDTTGTFGTYNINPYGATPPTIPPAGRVLFDLTAVNISSFLTNNQNTLSVQISGGTGGQTTLQGVQIDINAPSFNVSKSVDKTSTFSGDVLTYTTLIKNVGTLASNNVVFLDTLPSNVTFISNSFSINSVTIPGVTANPISYNIGTVPVGSVNTITFKVLVSTVANPTTIPNSFETQYSYTPVTGQTFTSVVDSNTVYSTAIPLYSPQLNSTKTTDLGFATVNSVLTYTITMKNTGTATATNVIFTDTIPSNTSFVPNSLFVNGNNLLGSNPELGVPLPDITINGVSTISFKVTVVTIPTLAAITNSATTTFNYFNNVSTVTNGVSVSNTVTTPLGTLSGSSTKSVDKTTANVGDPINYTVVLQNTGNVTATSISFIDTVPSGTSFNTGSIYIDGINYPSFTPNFSFTSPQIPFSPGKVTTVTFSVTVITLPSINPIVNSASYNYNAFINGTTLATGINSNNVATLINTIPDGALTINKTVSKSLANINDILLYTVTFKNTGSNTITSLSFLDTIPSGSTFNTGSVNINGTSFPALSTNFNFTSPAVPLGVNGTITVGFKVTVNTIPTPNPLINDATSNYSYSFFNGGGTVSSGVVSNSVSTKINYASFSTITKYVDKSFADCGDVLTYTIILPNTGNVTAQNILFQDTIPNGTTFITNSVFIDGINQPGATPLTGINIPNIAPGASTTLTFQVKVTC